MSVREQVIQIIDEFMDEGRRKQLGEVFWREADVDDRVAVITKIARLLRFREVSVERAPIEKKTSYLLRGLRSTGFDATARSALAKYHLHAQRDLMGAFLDSWGIPHKNGEIDEEPLPPPAEQVAKSVQALRAKFDIRDIAVYLATLSLLYPEWQPVASPIAQQIAEEMRERGQGEQERVAGAATAAVEKPGEGEGEEERLPEEAETFTQLDIMLIKAAVSSISEVEGSLSEDALGDMIEEVAQLNGDRHRSYFHRGFFAGLFGKQPDFSFPEANDSRLAWYCSGLIMALARRHENEQLASLVEKNREVVNICLKSEDACSSMAAEQLFKALRYVRNDETAIAVLESRHIRAAGPRFAFELLRIGADLIRRGRVSQARSLLSKLRKAAQEMSAPKQFVAELDRRLAQCHQATGEFSRAEQLLEPLTEDEELGPRIYADIGLVKGGFRSLSEVTPPRRADDAEQFEQRLAKGEDFFLKVAEHPSGINGQYCLGVLYLLREKPEDALRYLTKACDGMIRQREEYEIAGVLPRARVFHAVAIIQALEESQFATAADLLTDAMEQWDPEEWPHWMIREAVEHLIAFSPGQASRLLDQFLDRCNALAQPHLHYEEWLRRSEKARSALRMRAEDPHRTSVERWEDWRILLQAYLSIRDIEGAEDALDALEVLSDDSTLRGRFLELLQDRNNYDPAWSVDDAAWARVRVLEMEGRYREAASILRDLMHKSLSENDVVEAQQIWGWMLQYGIDEAEFETEQRRLEGALKVTSLPDEDELETDRPMTITVVGGNEIQQKYDETISEKMKEKYPNLSVTFIHTGWSSNWGEQFDDMKTQLDRSDAVVIMRYIRTQLGRRIRANVKVWRTCTGSGGDAIARSIQTAVHAVLAQRTEDLDEQE